jgi:hypothetical protein
MPAWNKPWRVLRVMFGASWRLASGALLLYVALRTKSFFLGFTALGFFYYGVSWLRAGLPTLRSREARLLIPAAGAGTRRSARTDVYRAPAREVESAREFYAASLAALPLPAVPNRPGRVLAQRLGLPSQADRDIWVAIGANLLIASLFAAAALDQLVPLAIIGVVGLPISAGLLVKAVWIRVGLSASPSIEVDQEPAFIGDTLQVHVAVRRRPVQRLQVDLVCEELVRYTLKSTFTKTHELSSQEILDERIDASSGQPFSRTLTVALPSHLPPSFEAKNNEITWHFRVRTVIKGWPDSDTRMVFRALPRPIE